MATFTPVMEAVIAYRGRAKRWTSEEITSSGHHGPPHGRDHVPGSSIVFLFKICFPEANSML